MPTTNRYQAYLFDLDGTLIDTAPDIGAALNHTLDTLDLNHVDEALTRHWVGHGAKVLIEQALNYHKYKLSNPDQIDKLLTIFLDYYIANIAKFSQPYAGVVDTLTALRQQGAQLAVVTNKLHSLALPLLQQLQMLDYFETVIGGDTAAYPKPHPAPIQLAIKTLDVRTQNCLFVGDSATDVNGALAANMHVACMRDGYNHGANVEQLGANIIIDHFSELLELKPSNLS